MPPETAVELELDDVTERAELLLELFELAELALLALDWLDELLLL